MWRQGHIADSLALLRETLRQAPNNLTAYVTTARIHAGNFDFDAMERVHERLLQQAPNDARVFLSIGQTYRFLNLPIDATTWFQRAAEHRRASADLWLELAALSERSHRLDEAEEYIQRAVRGGCAATHAGLIRARIQRRRNCAELAEATLSDLLKQLSNNDELSCEAWGELAIVKDSQDDFAGATRAILNCKRQQSATAQPFERAAERAQSAAQQLFGTLTRDDFVRWQKSTPHPAPRTALFTGFPRSGTTLLEQMLNAHPELVCSEERDYLGHEFVRSLLAGQGATPLLQILNQINDGRILQERARYIKAMEFFLGRSIADKMHIDKNPSYNRVIPVMLRLFPQSKLIVALRDPRDVVLSCYLRYLPLTPVSVSFLSPVRTAQRYAFDMGLWLKVRELLTENWCEVRYEDVVADFSAEVKRVLAAIGVSWSDAVLRYRETNGNSKVVTSPSYEAVTLPVHSRAIGRWRNYEQLLAPTLDILRPFLRAFNYDDAN